MAEKQNKENKSSKTDFELLTHKYSDFYEGFYMYDVREIDYPVYRTKVLYEYSKVQEIHPIIIAVLKTLQFLESVNDLDVYEELKNITQLDKDILNSILAEITVKGYLKQDNIRLSTDGKEILQKAKEVITEKQSDYLNIDGIFGTVLPDLGKIHQNDKKAREGSIEFKPYVKSRPRIEYLDEGFSDNKTLRQVLIENLQNKEKDVTGILEIAPNKFFNRYICLFYKDVEEDEKFLVLNHDYEIDSEATELFDRLMSEQKFTNENISLNCKPLLEESAKKFEEATPQVIEEKIKPVEQVEISDGKTIEVDEHKKYFIYVLENAKSNIYIQSPWINWRTLQIYKEYIKKAVQKGVNVTIKYGMKPRNRFDKAGIDNESKSFFGNLDKNCFRLINTDDHSKILICDERFMIMGSFNWLSFGGGNVKDARGETSSINMNKAEIKKQIEKFK
ncbi:phospholipase D-like domain-containing protein [Treponema pedis]|uniref:phospholipase D-like domain-containing protein n=1 Tax=Treponema pedis TaxID=409322 RepID=UPI000425EED8|nr:phospholipase D-like domain-containing protein [Treponema pedis]